MTRRRTLLCVIAGGLIAASLNAGAQRTEKMAHIGILCSVRCEGFGLDALRDGLRSAGWVEGRNLQIEFRAAGGQIDRLPALARELVDLKPDLIVAFSPQPSRAAKNATSTIPIVFVEQPTKFLLVINLKPAKALGLTISQGLLLRADEVIQ